MSYVRRVAAAGTVAALALAGCTEGGEPPGRPTATASASPSARPSPGGTLVAVPDVSRQALAAAERALSGAGLRFEVLSVLDTTLPDGEVLDTTPAAGRRVRPDSTITLREAVTVVAVPEVTGRTLADAAAAVRRAGLAPDEVGARGTRAPGDARVTGQWPPAGERVREGSHVTLDYRLAPTAPPTTTPPTTAPPTTAPPTTPPPTSAPPPTTAPPTSASPTPSPSTDPDDTTVPDVVGEDRADADAALQDAGLTAKLVTVERPDAPDGTVLRVLPAAGSRVARGNTVTLYVAVTTVAVPDVVGRPVDAADERLASVGLMPGHEPADAGQGSVVSAQEPAAGQRLRHGGEVLLQLQEPPTDPPSNPPTDGPTDGPDGGG